MIDFDKKNIIVRGNGYNYVLNSILDFLENSHINVLYANSYLYKTPLEYIFDGKKIIFDIDNYKDIISDNLFRIDYILVESDFVKEIDKWLSNIDINIIYVVDESFYKNLKNIDFNQEYKLFVKYSVNIQPAELEHYMVEDIKYNNIYSLKDKKISLIRDKNIKDLGID
jgi:hypothetical protein